MCFSPVPLLTRQEISSGVSLLSIPLNSSISFTNTNLLTNRSADDISRCLQLAPYNSHPGIDGLPYEMLQLLFQHSFSRRLFINTALLHRTTLKLPSLLEF